MRFLWLAVVSLWLTVLSPEAVVAQYDVKTNLVPISKGYAQTHVNAVIFRRNSISSFNGYQYVAFYDEEANVMLAKRKLSSDRWELHKTQYKGNVRDAHNSISIIHDGDGYLHMSWDHHNDTLRYAMSIEPESLSMGAKKFMIGNTESRVTYPEFYRKDNGDLVFLYRDGSSGNGNLLMNYYESKTKNWRRVQSNLIDGEGERNAYWQMCIDKAGTLHLSWVWRETGNVATNHDICYARSRDNGITWERSTGAVYDLPINVQNAEYVRKIPQNSNLINTTSITADANGNPLIATYYKSEEDAATQFKVFFKSEGKWHSSTVSERTTDFKLGGGGTRSVPISRPQIFMRQKNDIAYMHLIYRDQEFKNNVCLASAQLRDVLEWDISTIDGSDMSRWEPTYDTQLWEENQILHIYHQVTHQGSGEKRVLSPPTQVSVLEVTFD